MGKSGSGPARMLTMPVVTASWEKATVGTARSMITAAMLNRIMRRNTDNLWSMVNFIPLQRWQFSARHV